MVDDIEAEEQEEQEVKEKKGKKFPLKLLIIIVSVLVVGVLLAFGGFFVYNSMKSEAGDKEAVATAESDVDTEEEKGEEKNTFYQSLDTFYVNLGDKGETRYLKITISLELSEKSDKKYLDKLMPKVKDDILILLSSKTIEEISPAKGKMLLKNQIKTRINLILRPLVKVVNVYFTEFIVQ
jgi:flagellar FliL protein